MVGSFDVNARQVLIAPDGVNVGWVEWTSDVKIWNPDTGALVEEVRLEPTRPYLLPRILDSVFSSDGTMLVVAGRGGVPYVFDRTRTGSHVMRGHPNVGGFERLALSADGTRLGFIQSDEARTPIPLKRMPKVLKEATIAIEDEPPPPRPLIVERNA